MIIFKKLPLMILFLLCLAPIIILAAQDCPAIVEQAITATDAACTEIGRNQACYGNVKLEAVPQAGVEAFNFSQSGDLVDVTSVQSLTLSSMNEAIQEWGVALMKVQANLPDTLPGQNVTLLLFGEVELQNAAPTNIDPVTVSVTAKNNVNVRSGPSTNDGVVATLAAGETVTADGRNPDNTWLRVQLADGTPGWVFGDLVTVDGDVATLTLVDPLALVPPPSETTPTTEVFYFKSGVSESACAEVPNGLLIQSPVGVQRVQLTINGVNLTIGSTVFLQTAEGDTDQMVISTLAGMVQVEADGVQQTVIPGAQVSVPLDGNGQAAGAPSAPEPYDTALLTPIISGMVQGHGLFVHLEADSSDLLNQLIAECGLKALTIAEPTITLSSDELQTLTTCVDDFLASLVEADGSATAAGQNGDSATTEIEIELGAYDFAYTIPADNCPASIAPPDTDLMIITENGDGSFNVGAAGTRYVLLNTGSNTYQYDSAAGGDQFQITLSANSDGTLTFNWLANDATGAACNASGVLTYSSE